MIEFASSEQENAARAVRELASRLQDFLYYDFSSGSISDKSRNILEAGYRPLKSATDFFYGDNSPLSYEGRVRGTPFAKKPTTTEGK